MLFLSSERPVAEYVKVSRWTDSNTATLHAVETFEMKDDFLARGFVFTVKFDADGSWKIVKTERMSNQEALKD
jgi:hypothetical protein